MLVMRKVVERNGPSIGLNIEGLSVGSKVGG